MTILLSLSHEEAQRLRSILQDANEPTLLQKIEEELQRLQELDDFLAKALLVTFLLTTFLLTP